MVIIRSLRLYIRKSQIYSKKTLKLKSSKTIFRTSIHEIEPIEIVEILS